MHAYVFVNVQVGKVKEIARAFAKIREIKVFDAS
jgi:hypothetical protein